MARCLYHPDDCESERTVIIAELQGGENDPDVLLDQEVTATAFKAHPYRHPTIGWLSDLQTMTRDDLYGHYRRYYIPNNATLVIVGDVDTDDALRRAEQALRERFQRARRSTRQWTAEPEQTGERRVTIRREGTTAYLKVAYHAPAAADAGFFPALVLDTALTGAKGVNLWSSFRDVPPQRQARLYRALVETRAGLDGRRPDRPDGGAVPLHRVGDGDRRHAARRRRRRDARRRSTRSATTASPPLELARAKKQLHARFVFDNDSVTNIAHQLGYFETIAGVESVRVDRRARPGREPRSGRRRGAPDADVRQPDDWMVRAGRRSAGGFAARTDARWPPPSRPAWRRGASRSTTAPSSSRRKRTRRPPSRCMSPCAPGRSSIPPGMPGAAFLLSRVIDRGTTTRTGRSDCRRARQPRHLAGGWRQPSPDLGVVHVPRRRLRRRADARRRHSHRAERAGRRAGDAQGRGDHRDSPGPGQSRDPGRGVVDGAAVRRRSSIRTSTERHDRIGRGADGGAAPRPAPRSDSRRAS